MSNNHKTEVGFLKGPLLEVYNSILQKISTLEFNITTPEQVAFIATSGIIESLGGQVFYIPMNQDGARRERDIKICEEWENGRSDISELAIRHGISQQQIYAILSAKSEKYANKQSARKKRNELIYAAQQGGSTSIQLAKDFGMSQGGIKYVLENYKK